MPDKIDASSVPTKELLARYAEGKKFREKFDSNWTRNWNLYINNPWAGVQSLWFQSKYGFNKIFEFVEIMRGMLSDRKWGIDAMPIVAPKGASNKSVADKADKINKLLDHLWLQCRIQGKLAAALIHVFLKGTGILKVTFNPDDISQSGIGQIEVEVVDPTYVYVDPDATSVRDAAFIIEAKSMSLRGLMRRYPDKFQEILASGAGSSLDVAPRGSDGIGPAPADEGKRIDIYECWYHDETVVVLEETDTEMKVGKKYPNGRYTLMTSNGVVLEDRPNKYRMFPYVRIIEIPMPGEFWGGCSVDKGADIQLSINQVIRAIIDNGLWLVHGIWVADSTSGVTPRTLAGYGPRDVVIKHPGTEVRRDAGQALPPHIFQTLEQLLRLFDDVMGLPNVLRGIVPSRQPVQTTEQMRESGEVRTRERARHIEEALSDLGELLVMVCADAWTDSRSIRSSKATGGFEIFKLSKDDFDGWEFQIAVVPGSTLPQDQEGQFGRLMDMRKDGVTIPDKFLMRFAGIPGLVEAVTEMEAEAAAAAQSQEGGGGTGPPVPTTAEEFGLADPDESPGDQMPSPEDMANLDPALLADIEANGGFAAFP